MNISQNLYIPGAIILAGVLVAGAVIFNSPKSGDGSTATVIEETNNGKVLDVMEQVTSNDYILGDPNAPIVIVEYSDLECPFCKNFHQTMKQVMEEYGESGDVAWVYRHAPLTGLHPKAIKEAEAAECAGQLGGSVKFWEYVDRVFTITPSNNGLKLALLPDIAEEIGLPREEFEACLKENDFGEKIQGQLQDGIDTAFALGIRFGTPFSVFLDPNNVARPISGAQSFGTLKTMIDKALQETETE